MPRNWFETPLGEALIAEIKAEEEIKQRKRPATGTRMYANAVPNRFNQGFPGFNNSADSELVTSLRNLRSRSRQLIRDAGYAKSAKRVIVNNVIGTGVGLQCAVANQRGTLVQKINDAIEREWRLWCEAENCHTGGAVHFHDLERLMMGETFEAGEIFLQVHHTAFGSSRVPLALEIVEPERIVDGYAVPSAIANRATVRMGIEVDRFKKAIAYWVRDLHPGDIRMNVEETDRAYRVVADDVYHLRIVDRWPQTRGEPWLHAVAGKLADMNGYSEAEIIAARGAASYLGTIETPDSIETFGEEQADGSFQQGLQPGTTMKLAPGEKFNFISPNRPNSALDPFMRFMLREVAAGTGLSYESISRDYAHVNYSSGRLALLDDRDCWRALQLWFVRTFRQRFHRQWLRAAVLSGAIPEIDRTDYALDEEKYMAAFFRPRGWSWIDPVKEVAAYKDAVKGGFKTIGSVIGETAGGSDLEDVMQARHDELQYMKSLELVFDTSPEVYVPAESRGQVMVDPDTGEVVPAADLAPAPAGEQPPAEAEPATPQGEQADENDDSGGSRNIVKLRR